MILKNCPFLHSDFEYKKYKLSDWRKSGLTEYVCPGEVDPDIDDLAVYLNTTYYPVDVELKESNDPQDDLYIYNLALDQPKTGYITYFIAGEVDSDKGTIYFTTQARFSQFQLSHIIWTICAHIKDISYGL